MPQKKSNKINFLLLGAGIVMAVASYYNFSLNDDFVSLGIFGFAGIAFIILSVAPTLQKARAERIRRFAYMFFVLAILMLFYRLIDAKLDWI